MTSMFLETIESIVAIFIGRTLRRPIVTEGSSEIRMGIHSITHHPAALTITRPKSLVQPRFSSPSKLVPSYNKVSFPKTCIATPKRVSGSFQVKAELQSPMEEKAAADISQYKNILLPVTDKNPYLSEGTKQAVTAGTTLAKKNGASITVVVIDENNKEAITDHETRLSSIRWHLAQGGFEEFGLMERLGEGKKPTAIIGEVADDMNLDLVVMSMESIHSKHVDGNLLAEFIPCPVLLMPL
eukprot:TRINITY_DN3153_c0_g1_i1.p1 TRINITY_DN3153_c0_g1~~TRINITY_DN3153_c0_g1_i1.p1  ORF type:complete len:241 (+),score=39.11 TRINITY_DN3153_c0_g1_i1:163-885(+)